MEYKINEIFYSLQGEGHNAGRAAVFVRFSGCNLHCSFCDTDFTAFKVMSASDIVAEMLRLTKDADSKPMVVLTGGEPTLQADEALLDAIHEAGFRFIAMESNGTHVPPANLDWLTVSPKEHVSVKQCSELKVLFNGVDAPKAYNVSAQFYYLQPLDTGDDKRNRDIIAACVQYIKRHPNWQLSLQIHKLLGIR